MDTYLTICRKTVTACSYCGEPITPHTYMVCGRIWQRVLEAGKIYRLTKSFRYHAERESDGQNCWIAEAKDRLRMNPPVETRGRRSLLLPADMKAARLRVMQNRARAVARLNELMLSPLNQRDVNEVIRLGSKIEAFKEEILPLGGVPSTW